MRRAKNNVKYKYEYNGKGEANALNITNNAENLFIRSSIKYTDNDTATGIKSGAYIEITRDQHNNETLYDYDLKKGTLKSVTDPKGNKTFIHTVRQMMQYNLFLQVELQRLMNILTAGSSKINHNSTQYGFIL